MGKSNKAPANPAAQLLQEAETLQQRGERRSGQESLACFEQAVAKFQAALAHADASGASSLTGEALETALMGLGESLQQCGQGCLELVEALPDSQLTKEAEEAARVRACSMFSQSVLAYQKVRDAGTGRVQPEAAVCAGNVLCEWAELLHAQAQSMGKPGGSGGAAVQPQQPQQQQQLWAQIAQLFDQAKAMYEEGLAQEEDALTHSNLGDALMQYAQVLWDAGRPQEAEACCASAMQAYEQSCSMSDSQDGDDLPGLLCNWGVGATTAGQRIQDPATRTSLLDGAISRLASAAAFTRGDVDPLVALGDALTARAELVVPLLGDGAAAAIASPVAPAAPTPEAVSQAAGLLQRALQEGYSAALRINRSHPQALVGAAEAHAGMAKLAGLAGSGDARATHLREAVSHYEAALQAPEKLGGFLDRCDVRYNYACVLAQAGAAQQAAQLVAQLLQCGGVQASEVAADTDLGPAMPFLSQLPGLGAQTS